MNRTNLKNYSPQARRDFIQAMTDRAAFFGLTAKKIEPVVERGDLAVIAARAFPKSIAQKRKQLEDRIKRHGFEQTMEALAYTWFNRLVAIRFMELHGYLDHGYRVLSHPEGKPTPEVLEHAEHVELPGLKPETAIDLKLAGNKEADLYRLLLTAQCNALHAAMPFLFEKIDDETELLLPDKLLHSDSLIRKLVNEIDEEDWKEVEIIGWLYQFYISEKKDEVIGKVVASEDIPAATQLFTPNWIVKYLVQNTLGRQWLATYPQSSLRQQMEYYIEPAEQTPEVQEQLKAITPTSLNPEELTLLDPACGSGHILVEAYDLFKAIYQERGYRAKDIPALILEKNLFGLEIDDRAAQLAAFALMMKARADDRRIFDSEAKPNILAFEDSQGMNAAAITHALNSPINKEEMPPSEYLFEEIEEAQTPLFSKKVMAEKGHVSQGDIASLLELFENAKTFGSLIQVSETLAARLTEIEKRLKDVLQHGDLMHSTAGVIAPLVQQAKLLALRFSVVLANPPYIGTKYMNANLKALADRAFEESKSDLFAMFVSRLLPLVGTSGSLGLVTPFVWMFISSYVVFRNKLLSQSTITSLVQLEYNAFEPACVPVCVFTISRMRVPDFKGHFVRLCDFPGHHNQAAKTLEAINNPLCTWRFAASANDFSKIDGNPIAYWISDKERDMYVEGRFISQQCYPRKGLDTGENSVFLRLWQEVSLDLLDFEYKNLQSTKWFPYNKGGESRKWYGNRQFVIDWKDDGAAIRARSNWKKKKPTIRNQAFYFREGYTWTTISSSGLTARYCPAGALFDNGGCTLFADSRLHVWGALLNSRVASRYLEFLSPTLNYQPGDVGRILLRAIPDEDIVEANTRRLVSIAKQDWDYCESSWDFLKHPFCVAAFHTDTIQETFEKWSEFCESQIEEAKRLETENNRLFIGAYCLEEHLAPDVTDDQITLTRPNSAVDVKQLLSYAIGCMMGRYSLDIPGLIYAHSANQGFDANQYKTFPADDDGIVPLLETAWGIRDDGANRIVEFIGVAWPKERLEENLKFIAYSLGPTNNEQPRETIRRYLSTGFYKEHMNRYKGPKHPPRPIYWLFSSGKQRAFQCLVYLHRYHEGTLARLRTEYVIPLQGQIASRIEQLEGDKTKATSTSHRNRLQKDQDNLKKQQAELLAFEEKLKHAAEQKISIDLDDGVKVNYAKFGDLLAESKAITGGKEEE